MSNAATNEVIDRATSNEREVLVRSLARVELEAGKVLHVEGQPIERVWFPLSGVVALVAPTPAGIVAGGVVGREGAVGVSGMLSLRASPLRAEVLWGGQALVAHARVLAQQLHDWPVLRVGLYRHEARLLASVAMEQACKKTHTPHARLARRVLELLDRGVPAGDRLAMDALARSLGEADVDAAARSLAARGVAEVIDRYLLPGTRTKLVGAACNCYSAGAS